ncbi:hypothetical protein FB451DRAFT_1194267 [Mycena latifolia]|nr:hypothetical protein FB451DRAFT_1194267 [Mycena latifolia]
MLVDIGKNFAHFIFLRNIMIPELNCKATYWPIREDVRGGRKIPTWVELAGTLELLQEYAHKDIQFKAYFGYYCTRGATGTTGTPPAPAPAPTLTPAAVALHRSCSPSLLALCPRSGTLPSPLALAASSLRNSRKQGPGSSNAFIPPALPRSPARPREDHAGALRVVERVHRALTTCGAPQRGRVHLRRAVAAEVVVFGRMQTWRRRGGDARSAGDRAGGTDDASGGEYRRRCARYENETRGGERKGRRTAQGVGSADINAASSVAVIAAGVGALGQHYNSRPRTCGMSEVVRNKKGNHTVQGSWTDGRQMGLCRERLMRWSDTDRKLSVTYLWCGTCVDWVQAGASGRRRGHLWHGGRIGEMVGGRKRHWKLRHVEFKRSLKGFKKLKISKRVEQLLQSPSISLISSFCLVLPQSPYLAFSLGFKLQVRRAVALPRMKLEKAQVPRTFQSEWDRAASAPPARRKWHRSSYIKYYCIPTYRGRGTVPCRLLSRSGAISSF